MGAHETFISYDASLLDYVFRDSANAMIVFEALLALGDPTRTRRATRHSRWRTATAR